MPIFLILRIGYLMVISCLVPTRTSHFYNSFPSKLDFLFIPFLDFFPHFLSQPLNTADLILSLESIFVFCCFADFRVCSKLGYSM